MAVLQRLLVERRGVITFYHDLKFDHPAFAALQWLGARGLNRGYHAHPETKLTRREGCECLGRILQAEGKTSPETPQQPEAELRAGDVVGWLRRAGYAAADPAPSEQLEVAQFASIAYRAMTPK